MVQISPSCSGLVHCRRSTKYRDSVHATRTSLFAKQRKRMSEQQDLKQNELDQLSINTLRFLAVDAVEKAKSGHPGAPLGDAPIAYLLYHKYMRHNPANSHWSNRDRFVLSNGHASALLYGVLHLSGYNVTIEDLQQFRQYGS